MTINLLLRSEKGSPLDATEHDDNLTKIETAINTNINVNEIDIQDTQYQSGYDFRLKIQGLDDARVVQGYAEDVENDASYIIHSTLTDVSVINKYSLSGDRIQTSSMYTSTANALLGHQGLSIEKRGGTNYFWSSTGYSDANDESINKCTRFEIEEGDVNDVNDPLYPGGLGIINEVVYELFDGYTGEGNTTPTVSSDGNYLVAKKYIENSNDVEYKVFDISIFSAPENVAKTDYSSDHLYSFTVSDFHDPTNYPVQGTACDGVYIYAIAGGSSTSVDSGRKRVAKFSLDGSFQEIYNECEVGLNDSHYLSSHYEPEGLFIKEVDGRNYLGVLIAAGSGAAERRGLVYTVKPKQGDMAVRLSDTSTFNDSLFATCDEGKYTTANNRTTFYAYFNEPDLSGMTGASNLYVKMWPFPNPAVGCEAVLNVIVTHFNDGTATEGNLQLLLDQEGYATFYETRDSNSGLFANVNQFTSGSTLIKISGTIVH